MTANEYIVLLWLHVYGRPPGHPELPMEPWVQNALGALDNRNMIVRQDGKIKILERGEVLIEHLKTMPMPVMKWNMP